MKQNYHYLSINEVQKSIRERTISPVEVVENCLERIEDLNPKLNRVQTRSM
jgi:Asp-tRNA(Asn)/Glu-tRNA(Gln) amidotransferase A subunit family amidase